VGSADPRSGEVKQARSEGVQKSDFEGRNFSILPPLDFSPLDSSPERLEHHG
jgi:hypothetical protein